MLIVEDEPLQRRMLATMIERLGYIAMAAPNGRDAINQLKANNIDAVQAVLLDLNMPELNGYDTMQWIQRNRPELPVVILTGVETLDAAIGTMKAGAFDFLCKPAKPDALKNVLAKAIEQSALTRHLRQSKPRQREGFNALIGHSGGLEEAVHIARKASRSNITILLLGESSTGKASFARAIHAESARAHLPYVCHPCAASDAIPHELFEQAVGGTLYLSDFHALSEAGQITLLHQLQWLSEQGKGKDVRIIASSDRDLQVELEQGRLRADLYFRLSALSLFLPPLRARRQDIPELARHLIERIALREGLPSRALNPGALDYLRDYSWPGNLRQLEGLIHQALLLCEEECLTRELLEHIHLRPQLKPAIAASADDCILLRNADGLPRRLCQLEEDIFRKTLLQYNQNVSRAAKALGIAKSTLYRRLPSPPA